MRELIGPDCKRIELGDEFIVCPSLNRVVWGAGPFDASGWEPLIRRSNDRAVEPIIPSDLDERIEKYLNEKKKNTHIKILV